MKMHGKHACHRVCDDTGVADHDISEDDLYRSLSHHWGYRQFRPNQLEACKAILAGRDCFYMTATGSGKSLVYLLPTISLSDKGQRVCSLIISPLISLMEDQVRTLLAMQISACMLSRDSSQLIEQHAMAGDFNFVYCTPEKAMVMKNQILQLSQKTRIVCCAIDESHCVSEWGAGFRPEYRNLSQLRIMVGIHVPFVVLTASATIEMQNDIINCLQLRNPLIVRTTINRKNLKYVVKESFSCDPVDVIHELNVFWKNYRTTHTSSSNIDIPSSSSFPPTLVYTMTKKSAEEIAQKILQSPSLRGISVEFYHAGLTSKARSKLLEEFLENKINIVVATTAFGMGINKPDIRLVMHYGLPISVESYYQQTGRGGRDDLPTSCVLLWSRDNEKQCRTLANPSTSSGQWDPVECVKSYARGDLGCRRKFLMNYFDEETSSLPPLFDAMCCDLCDGKQQQADPLESAVSQTNVSREVHMLLMTLYVIGTCYSFKGVISILLGRHDDAAKKISSEYSGFEFFGCGALHKESWWRALLNQLVDVDKFILADIRTKATGNAHQKLHYFTYRVTALGEDFLKGGLPVVVAQYSELRHQYRSDFRSELLRLEIANELKRYYERQKSDTTLQTACAVAQLTQEKSQSQRKKQKVELTDGNAFHDFTEFQTQQKLESTMKQIHANVRELIKRERLLIAERGGFNVQSVFSSNDMNNLLEKIITPEFVAGSPYVPSVSELSGRIFEVLQWAKWKTDFATDIAIAILNALHPNAVTSNSFQPEKQDNEVVAQVVLANQDVEVHRNAVPSFAENLVSLYRPNYFQEEDPVISLSSTSSDVHLASSAARIDVNYGATDKTKTGDETLENNSIVRTPSMSSNSLAASKAHKKRVLMTGLPGFKSRLK